MTTNSVATLATTSRLLCAFCAIFDQRSNRHRPFAVGNRDLHLRSNTPDTYYWTLRRSHGHTLRRPR